MRPYDIVTTRDTATPNAHCSGLYVETRSSHEAEEMATGVCV